MEKVAAPYPDDEFVQQPVAQILLVRNIALVSKLPSNKGHLWHAMKITENG